MLVAADGMDSPEGTFSVLASEAPAQIKCQPTIRAFRLHRRSAKPILRLGTQGCVTFLLGCKSLGILENGGAICKPHYGSSEKAEPP